MELARKNFIKDKWMITDGSIMNAYANVYQGTNKPFTEFKADMKELAKLSQYLTRQIDAEVEGEAFPEYEEKRESDF